MTKSSQLWGLLGLVLLGICQVSCHSPSAGAGKPGSSDGSSGTGTTGDPGGTNPNGTGGVASSTGGDGSGDETGMPADGMSSNGGSASGGASSSVPPDVLAGTCPAGFVACYGVCMEAALMGADCKPALCAAPPAGTTPPSRAGGISARGFSWNVANDGSATSVTFKPGPAGGGLSPTIGAAINYRVNGSAAMQTAALAGPSGSTSSITSALALA